MTPSKFIFFFFNDTATTEIYTLSLHDALPISLRRGTRRHCESTHNGAKSKASGRRRLNTGWSRSTVRDRKSTRLNSSHGYISYAVFCLKKKKNRILTASTCWNGFSLYI